VRVQHRDERIADAHHVVEGEVERDGRGWWPQHREDRNERACKRFHVGLLGTGASLQVPCHDTHVEKRRHDSVRTTGAAPSSVGWTRARMTVSASAGRGRRADSRHPPAARADKRTPLAGQNI
jgi:hypothetical protein